MQKTITLAKVWINTKSKEGKPFNSPKVAIQFSDDNGKMMTASSFVEETSPAMEWKIGDKVTLEFQKKGDFINFTPPRGKNMADEIKKIWEAIHELQGKSPETVADPAGDDFFA